MQTRQGAARRRSFSRENRRRWLHLAGLPHNAWDAPLFPGGLHPDEKPRQAKPLSPWSISLPGQSLPERNGSVTFFARPAESSVMRVILAVAGVTRAGGADFRAGARLVTGMALERAVGAGQGVGGLLVVIETPARPPVGVVAGGAVGAQTSGVVHIFVAAGAGAGGILEGGGAMAGLAGDGRVQANEGKAGQVMVEGHRLAPAGLLVAALAGGPELALVGIILAVAGGAVGGQPVAPGVAGVAAFTGELGMAAAQGKPRRLVVVEADGRPFGGCMAGLAAAAVAPRMLVLQAVTGAAAGGQTLVALAGVALGAGNRLVGGHQRELGLAVVEGFHPPPGLLPVTAFALFAQPTFVRVGRPVAVEAAPGRLAVFRVL